MDARGIVMLLVLVACESSSREDDDLRIVDQSGAEFRWVCGGDDHCAVHRIAGVSPEGPSGCGGSTPDSIYTPYALRFFEVVGVCHGVSPDGVEGFGMGGNAGRYLVCETDDDCPAAFYDQYRFAMTADYECRAGFCQSADEAPGLPTRPEMLMLCTGEEPRYEPYVVDPALDAALDAACPVDNAPCTSVPPGCPDPR
jgi:hypothetical protein